MNGKLTRIERIIRYILGIFFMTWAIAGGPTWTLVGIFLLFTASFGSCPIYWLFKVNLRL